MTIRATLTAPPKKLIQGGDISPLLEGAVFGSVSPGASASGVEITSVKPGSKAAAGLRKGDIISSVNRESVAGPDEFAAKVKESPKALLLTLVRDGNAQFLILQ
jgi:serine protease Do/serine protease DegQ